MREDQKGHLSRLTEDQKCIHRPLLRGTAVTVCVAFMRRFSWFSCGLFGRNGGRLLISSVHLHLLDLCAGVR